MRVTVDLTDAQCDAVIYESPRRPQGTTWDFHWAVHVLRDAIAAARPKPLKVGDKVTTLGSALMKEVVAIGIDPCNGRRWMVVADQGSSSPFLWIDFQAVQMADGSPIVWPEP